MRAPGREKINAADAEVREGTLCVPWRPLRLIILVFLFCGSAAAQGLRAGAAKAVITPDVRGHTVYLAGFGHNRVATGIHDDLYARCLALSVSSNTLVVCSADLIGLFHEDVRDIRGMFHREAPPGSILVVACTHDHEGPDTLGLWGPTPLQSGVDAQYLQSVKQRIAAAALEALRAMKPAHMELARDDHPLLGQLQSDDRPPFVKDPFLLVMRLTTTTGAPIATLVNWSDHAETLGRNTQITADYPHWLCAWLEQRLGGTAVFVNGSVGKLSTLGSDVVLQDRVTGKIAEDGTWLKADLIGSMLGRLAERALKSAERVSPDALTIRVGEIFVPLTNERFRVVLGAGVFGDRRPLFTNGKRDTGFEQKAMEGAGQVKVPTGHDLRSEVNDIRLSGGGRTLAEIVTVPGEIYPELTDGGITRYPGADYPKAPFEPTVRGLLKARYQFVLGLANDELGYLIPKAEWDDAPPWLMDAPKRWYGEINSCGPDAAAVVLHGLEVLIRGR